MDLPAPAVAPPIPHVVLLPFTLLGHVNPLILVARALTIRGFNCTIIVNQEIFNTVMKEEATSNRSKGSIHGIQFVALRQEPSSASSSSSSSNTGWKPVAGFRAHNDEMMRMRAGFEEFIRKLGCSPCCLIADNFVTWSHDSAHKLGLPRFGFETSNASNFCIKVHFPMLISKGLLPFTDASYEDPHFRIDCIPGVPPLRPVEFCDAMRYSPDFVLQQMQHIEKDAGVVVNTIYELEREPLDVLQKNLSIFPFGVLCHFSHANDSNTVNLSTEGTNCIRWLDAQALSSVLYVSFGSMARMPAEQMTELAEGLEASQQPFLWVLHPNAVKGSQAFVLPEGFAERTKERGFIVSWAPQLQVLAHSSLGGFLTHCGWNSIMENLSTGGVTMICWPQLAEQSLNCRLIVDLWKIGIEFGKEKDEIVVKGEVEQAVRALMQGEEGKAMKMRACQLKETVRNAVQEGGSSHTYFEAFVESLKMNANSYRPKRAV